MTQQRFTGATPMLSFAAAALFFSIPTLADAGAGSAPSKSPAPLGSGTPAIRYKSSDRLRVEHMLTAELQRVVDRQPRLEGQAKIVRVKVRLDTQSKALVIDLSRGFLPKFNGGRFEDQQSELTNVALSVLSGSVSVNEVVFLIEGKPLQSHFPEELRPSRRASAQAEPTQLVAVSAGHGYFYHHGEKNWKLQRPFVNGVQEDFITQYFAQRLESYLSSRSNVNFGIARTHSTAIHAPSGQPWWKMSGRTYLESIYPSQPAIWSTAANTGPDREYDQDINSRPLFANHIGAHTLISLHTNADDGSGTARGTTVLYHTGRSADQALGRSVLCYMKEQIQAQSAYKTFPVASEPFGSTSKGENTRAAMPAIIVEIGFHTNATDAAALKDTAFQQASMRGVEKGYRLWRLNKPCAVQAVTSIPDASGYTGTPFPVTVNFVGYPRLPLTVETKVVTCAENWTCSNVTRTPTMISETQFKYNINCTGTHTGGDATFVVETHARDSDGVRMQPVRNTYTCRAPSSTNRIT